MRSLGGPLSRRQALTGAAALTVSRVALGGGKAVARASKRPAPVARRFSSPAVEQALARTRALIADPKVAWLFDNCLPNTLDTTVTLGELDGASDTFVITGDIEAMWLRDSTAQVWPYLPFAAEDSALKRLLAGVVRRQTRCIRLDPYANAFLPGPGATPYQDDETKMEPGVHERKWELDSLCYPVRLAHGYWKATGDASVLDAAWKDAARAVVRTFKEQQRLTGPGPYTFRRKALNPASSLPGRGRGNPTRPNGLIHSMFRPSDDACVFPLLIPSNFFAVSALRQLEELLTAAAPDLALAAECRALADQVQAALALHARGTHPTRGEVLAFEVDGFGNALFLDDANAPSLLSLPYFGGVEAKDPLYQSTRAFVLSPDNPWFSRGKVAEGIGGPHVGPGMVWPLSITMRALTSTDDAEVLKCLRMLRDSDADTGFMHEAFNQDDPTKFTRPWFAWANSLFGELVLTLAKTRPELLKRPLG